MTKPKLIAVDWGTTRLRAYLVDDQGRVLERAEADEGIMAVPPGGFPATLRRHVEPWLASHGALPVVLAGMVGSRNGWVEAPYVAVPHRYRRASRPAWRRWISATASPA